MAAQSWLSKLTSAIGKSMPGIAAETSLHSRNVAKDRLAIILTHQRGAAVLENVDRHQLQTDVLSCVKKHLKVDEEAPVGMKVRREGDQDIFEMYVNLIGNRR
ncbi:unnamed protein product [Heterosigma akashiwo]|mmetsp:Transcript_2236/g.3435  ORF Transcript_2236/g.3435 Transcript_2236/m.3435 type:complete len:103 (-) Transcript_2236:352-660(-)